MICSYCLTGQGADSHMKTSRIRHTAAKKSGLCGLASVFSLIVECCLKTRVSTGEKKLQSFLFLTSPLCAKEI